MEQHHPHLCQNVSGTAEAAEIVAAIAEAVDIMENVEVVHSVTALAAEEITSMTVSLGVTG